MVKRRTTYSVVCEKFRVFGICTHTKKSLNNKIKSISSIDCTKLIVLRETSFKSNRNPYNPDSETTYYLDLKEFQKIFLARSRKRTSRRSIRKLWHRWNHLIRSIIPAGFQVLANKYEAMPTALNIRQRLKSLIPTAYNCYLLDRDIRRYLGKALRHA